MYLFNNVSFKYSEYILKDLSLEIEEKKIGIVGENGIGKTTLLKLMDRQMTPQSGEIIIQGNTYFVQFDISKYYKFTPRDMLDLFGKLEAFQNKDPSEYIQALKMTSFMDTPIGKLSKGTVKKVALLLGLMSVHPVLLIDEPFESLDEGSNENLIRLFRKEDRGLVIVSHDRDMLARSVDQIYQLENKGLNLIEESVLL